MPGISRCRPGLGGHSAAVALLRPARRPVAALRAVCRRAADSDRAGAAAAGAADANPAHAGGARRRRRPGERRAFTSNPRDAVQRGDLAGSDDRPAARVQPAESPDLPPRHVPLHGGLPRRARGAERDAGPDGLGARRAGGGRSVSRGLGRPARHPAAGRWRLDQLHAAQSARVCPADRGAASTRTQPVPACEPGQAGLRNQNIYTARLTRGLFTGVVGNAKPVDTIERGFPIFVQNTTGTVRSYRLDDHQPAAGGAGVVPAV